MATVKHYETREMQCIDVIRAALTPEEFKGFLKGNTIKYMYREGEKNDAKHDRYKAADYACMLSEDCWLSEYSEKRGKAPTGQFCYDSTK